MGTTTNNCAAAVEPRLAVIDTETNYENEVMSIGIVIAHAQTYQIIDERYYILTPEYTTPSMFGGALLIYSDCKAYKRPDAIADLRALLQKNNVENLFAYNAKFDYHNLPELQDFAWHDIMRVAAYRQYNPCIPEDAECYSTGRLKRNYSVEAITRMLTKNRTYFEKHNAVYDARDELRIMQLLGHPSEWYPCI